MQSATDDHARSCEYFYESIEIVFPIHYRESLVLDSCSLLDPADISYVVVLFSCAFRYRDIHDFISFIVSVLYILYDFRQKPFRVLVQVDDDILLLCFRESLFPVIGEI